MIEIYSLSIIVPIYMESKDSYIYSRVTEVIENFETNAEIEIIIVDASPHSFITHLKSEKNKIIHFNKKQEQTFSLAKLRNIGAEYASANTLLFFDVDLVCSQYTITQILNTIQYNFNQKIIMFPYLFLTQKATEKFTPKNENLFTHYKESFLLGENQYISQIGLSSSIILICKTYFYEIGGFSPTYQGHGSEEFDFLHKSSLVNIYEKQNNDYSVNSTDYFAAKQLGFRKYLSYQSIALLFDNLYFIHKWHPKNTNHAYYSNSLKNKELFNEKLLYDISRLSTLSIHGCKLPDYHHFLEQIQLSNGYPVNNYCGLFKLKPGLSHFTKKNKFFKFLKNPKIFLIDMYKNLTK